MKGDLTKSILEMLAEGACDMTALFEAFMSAGYGASYGKVAREKEKIKRARLRRALEKEEELRALQRYYNLLYKLKKDGLIAAHQNVHGRVVMATKAGMARLRRLRARSSANMPPAIYKKTGSARAAAVIIIFDIPEKDRAKRAWLRSVLRNMGFRMVQKSVWIGTTKMPGDFIDDLHRLRLTPYVEIFEITRAGSLKASHMR